MSGQRPQLRGRGYLPKGGIPVAQQMNARARAEAAAAGPIPAPVQSAELPQDVPTGRAAARAGRTLVHLRLVEVVGVASASSVVTALCVVLSR